MAKEYENLVAERIIPTEIISKVIILSQGALWKHRMIRQQPSERKQSSSSSSSAIESRIASHVLALHESLLQIGTAQLKEAAMEEQMEGEAGAELKDDLAQRITATFRRTLPALRMSGKWIRGNLRYLSQAQVQAERPGQLHSAEEPPVANDAESRGGKGKGRDTRREKPPRTTNTISLPSLPSFWLAYVTFINSLLESFPVEKIPRLTAPLEEDTEVVGFLPLKKFMLGDITGIGGAIRPGSPKDGAGGGGNAKAEKIVVVVGVNGKTSTKQVGAVKAIGRDQVHPNEEQLMRISDMLVDANAVAEDGVRISYLIFFWCIFLVRAQRTKSYRTELPNQDCRQKIRVHWPPGGYRANRG